MITNSPCLSHHVNFCSCLTLLCIISSGHWWLQIPRGRHVASTFALAWRFYLLFLPDIDDYKFPLFVTSRQLLLLLDAWFNEAVTYFYLLSLQEIDDYKFPLFVTSRQLLLLLDASLEPTNDWPRFFERNEDGSLKVTIHGWGADEEIFAFVPLDDSDDEGQDLYEEVEEGKHQCQIYLSLWVPLWHWSVRRG